MDQEVEVLEVKDDVTDVAVIAPNQVEVVFQSNGGESLLERLRQETEKFMSSKKYDMSIKNDRDEVARFAYKLARAKNEIERVGKEYSAKLKAMPKIVDAERKRIWDIIEKMQNDVRKPVDEWESVEAARKDAHTAELNRLRGLAVDLDGLDAETLVARQDELLNHERVWEEFETEAKIVIGDGVSTLARAIVQRRKYEEEQAELAVLRQKQAEQEQIERDRKIAEAAAAKAKADAELKVQQERDAAEKEVLRLKLQAEQAENARIKAEQDAVEAKRLAEQQALAAVEAEKAKAAAEAKKLADEQARRDADIEHRRTINRSVINALLVTGISEEQAKAVLTAIVTSKIPSVSIKY